jgi:diguanylate cyclase (GGDEF)-like protein
MPDHAVKIFTNTSAYARAIGFLILVCLSLVGMEVWSIQKAYDVQLEEAAVATGNMTQSIAQHADDTIRAADAVLLGLVERIERDGMTSTALANLHPLLQAQYAQMKFFNGILVYDADGNWVATSMAQLPPAVNNADREYFRFHRSHSERGPHVSPPVRSRSTGRWIIPVSRRVDAPDGKFAGVVMTAIEMDYFEQFYDTFDVGNSGSILLAMADGTLLTRRPFDERTIGKSVLGGPVFTQLRTAGPGTRMLTARLDGVERLYSYRLVAHYPLVVATALAKEDVLVTWRAAAWRSAAVLAVLLVMLAAVGASLVRQIRRRETAEAELTRAKSDLEQANRSLEMLSLQDSLTGIGNRRQFDATLQRECERARRAATPLSLLLIDVDHFKRFNDLYGHPAGDACLRRIGQAVSTACLRPADAAARYGGEEFAVILPSTDAQGAATAAERIQVTIEELEIPHAANPAGRVTISIGASLFKPNGTSNDTAELISAADLALYRAKTEGRNRVVFSGAARAPHPLAGAASSG